MGQLLREPSATFTGALCEFLEFIGTPCHLQDRMAMMVLNGDHMILVDLVCSEVHFGFAG